VGIMVLSGVEFVKENRRTKNRRTGEPEDKERGRQDDKMTR
jgi:hypothetical protein